MTSSIHLHNHGIAGPDAQAAAVQQELSAALMSNIMQCAQCGLAMAAVRQLVQLELGAPFLMAGMKKQVRPVSYGPAAMALF